MSNYYCSWCGAEITSDEKMVSIALMEIKRKPKRWIARSVFFDSDDDEVTLHTRCFLDNTEMISRHLFPMGAPMPKKRTAHAEFPMWVDR